MSGSVEIFENEEASKLLDYFVAYKKLMRKVEYIKCISALNSEIHFCQNPPSTESNTLTQISENQPKVGLPEELMAKP
jgi:hypothetical protein